MQDLIKANLLNRQFHIGGKCAKTRLSRIKTAPGSLSQIACVMQTSVARVILTTILRPCTFHKWSGKDSRQECIGIGRLSTKTLTRWFFIALDTGLSFTFRTLLLVRNIWTCAFRRGKVTRSLAFTRLIWTTTSS